MHIKITSEIVASANSSGNQTKLYKKDEVVECNAKWQMEMAKNLVDSGFAMEVKIDAPKEKKVTKTAKKVSKKITKKTKKIAKKVTKKK